MLCCCLKTLFSQTFIPPCRHSTCSPYLQGLANLVELLQKPVVFQEDETKLLKVWNVPEGVELPFCGWPSRNLNQLFYRASHSPLIALIFKDYHEHCSRFDPRNVQTAPDGAVDIDDMYGSDESRGSERKSSIVRVDKVYRGCPIKLVVNGPPGQGKSVFLNVILLEALPKGITVVCQTGAGSAFVFTPKGVREVPFVRLRNIPELNTNNKQSYKTIYLYDSRDGTPSSLLYWVDAFTVVASSPDIENYRSITRGGCSMLYVYPWTLAELKAAVPFVTSDRTNCWADTNGWAAHEDVLARVGCSLRLLLMPPEDLLGYSKALDHVIDNITSEKMEAAIWAVKYSRKDKSKEAHMLFTYAPKNGVMDFKDFELVPVTPEIGNRLSKSLAEKEKGVGKTLSDFFSAMHRLVHYLAGYGN